MYYNEPSPKLNTQSTVHPTLHGTMYEDVQCTSYVVQCRIQHRIAYALQCIYIHTRAHACKDGSLCVCVWIDLTRARLTLCVRMRVGGS